MLRTPGSSKSVLDQPKLNDFSPAEISKHMRRTSFKKKTLSPGNYTHLSWKKKLGKILQEKKSPKSPEDSRKPLGKENRRTRFFAPLVALGSIEVQWPWAPKESMEFLLIGSSAASPKTIWQTREFWETRFSRIFQQRRKNVHSNLCPAMYSYGTIHVKNMCLVFIPYQFIYSYHFLSAHLFLIHWNVKMPLVKAMLHWSSMPVAEALAVVTPEGCWQGIPALKSGCFQKYWVFPPNHPFVHRIFHYKPSILGSYFWKHPSKPWVFRPSPRMQSWAPGILHV